MLIETHEQSLDGLSNIYRYKIAWVSNSVSICSLSLIRRDTNGSRQHINKYFFSNIDLSRKTENHVRMTDEKNKERNVSIFS